MKHSIFKELTTIIYRESGIKLEDHKKSLVEGRISRRMRILNLSDYEEYLSFLKNEPRELDNMLDVISTNVTHFYRESSHFEILHSALEKWVKKGQSRFRLWCAASSSGEEPYTMSMVLSDVFGDNKNIDAKILATDISRPMLLKCQEAKYKKEEFEKLPTKYQNEYTKKIENSTESLYTIVKEVKDRVLFKRVNLSIPPFPMKGPMDVIFIRNVMIYFDRPVKQKLIDEAYRLLKPGGLLFIGHSENLSEVKNKFKTIAPAAYIKKRL